MLVQRRQVPTSLTARLWTDQLLPRQVCRQGRVDDANVHSTDIEIYFSRCFGLGLLTIAALAVLLTGSIPLTSSADAVSRGGEDPRAPYTSPTMLITTLFHAALAFYDYIWYSITGRAALALGMTGSTIMASVGLWCLLFATSQGRISPRTGADKRTSGFPFKNAEADKRFPDKKRI